MGPHGPCVWNEQRFWLSVPTQVASIESVIKRSSATARREETARAAAIVARLQAGFDTSEEVFAAFAELDALPSEIAREALEQAVGPMPDPAQLDPEIRRRHGMPPPPLTLVPLRTTRDADVLDLGPIAEEQLRIAGRTWDGLDLEPEERLDGEREDTFAGTLVVSTFGDESGVPLFDVFTYGEDSGVIFRAGTTELVGAIAYGKVEMKDRRARTALEQACTAEVPKTVPVKKKTAGTKKKTAAVKKKTTTTKKKSTAKRATKKRAAS
jgi:hypothetical protein